MKMNYIKILVFAMVAVLFTTALHCRAAEDVNKEEDNIWSEDAAKWEHRRFEPIEERIDRIMNQLAETDPNKAEQLKQLQQQDPEKFKTELRRIMREQYGKKFKERMKEQTEQHMRRHRRRFGPGDMPPDPCDISPNLCPAPFVTPGPNGMPGGKGMRRHGEPFGPGHIMPEMGMHWKYDKYLDWLKENYAVEAEKLAELKDKDPSLYWKQLGLGLKKYGRIAEAARENPRLAEVLKKDLELRQQQDKLLGQIETATDKEKQELVKELKEVLGNRFDVIVERKQIEYEQLLEKLERLKNEVEQRKAKMEKWKNTKFKNDSIKARIEELLGKSNNFTW